MENMNYSERLNKFRTPRKENETMDKLNNFMVDRNKTTYEEKINTNKKQKKFKLNNSKNESTKKGKKLQKKVRKYTLDEIAQNEDLLRQVLEKTNGDLEKQKKHKPQRQNQQSKPEIIPIKKRAKPESLEKQDSDPYSEWIFLLDALLENATQFTCKEKIIDFSQIAESLKQGLDSGIKCKKQWKELKDFVTEKMEKKDNSFFQNFRLELMNKGRKLSNNLVKRMQYYQCLLKNAVDYQIQDSQLQQDTTKSLLKTYAGLIDSSQERDLELNNLETALETASSSQNYALSTLSLDRDLGRKIPFFPQHEYHQISHNDQITMLKGVLSYGEKGMLEKFQKYSPKEISEQWSKLQLQMILEIERIYKNTGMYLHKADWIKAFISKAGIGTPGKKKPLKTLSQKSQSEIQKDSFLVEMQSSEANAILQPLGKGVIEKELSISSSNILQRLQEEYSNLSGISSRIHNFYRLDKKN